MKFLIPVEKIDNLEKKVNSIRNKGANVTFDTGEIKMVKDDFGYFHKCQEVEVEGNYIINGWQFVATIEHTPNGNIIRCAVPELEDKIPSKYLTAGPECEHCHRIRDRKDTYLIYNEKEDEFKQVGKTCLKEYTGGLDATVCAQIASVLIYVENLQNEEYEAGRGRSNNYVPNKYVKKLAYSLVKKNGYIPTGHPNGTAATMMDLMFNNKQDEIPELASDKEIEEVTDWANTLTSNGGYIYNALVAWKNEYIEPRDFGLISSFIGMYFKQKSEKVKEQQKEAESSFVGEVGDKITIEVANIRVLYNKGSYVYNSPTIYVWEIVDNKGNVYVWSTDKDLEYAKKIIATVKDHQEYRGIKQTVITRGKILDEAGQDGMSVTEALNYLLKNK